MPKKTVSAESVDPITSDQSTSEEKTSRKATSGQAAAKKPAAKKAATAKTATTKAAPKKAAPKRAAPKKAAPKKAAGVKAAPKKAAAAKKPATKKAPAKKSANGPTRLPAKLNIVDRYLQEISRYDLLTREGEFELAKEFQATADPDLAHAMVTANLRFVVKIAYEYRNYNVKVIDLIQEGNIGLMMAVKKFNADRGYRLISYAVWWIKAYMQNFIIKNWSMSKIPLGRKNRMLLSEIMRKDRDGRADSDEGRRQLIDEMVFEGKYEEKEDVRRVLDQMILAAKDFYLDQEMDSETDRTYMSMLASDEEGQEDMVARSQLREILAQNLKDIGPSLSDKERYILQHRVLEEDPETLQEIGDRFSISRERVRQIENNLKKKLRKRLSTQDVNVFLE